MRRRSYNVDRGAFCISSIEYFPTFLTNIMASRVYMFVEKGKFYLKHKWLVCMIEYVATSCDMFTWVHSHVLWYVYLGT